MSNDASLDFTYSFGLDDFDPLADELTEEEKFQGVDDEGVPLVFESNLNAADTNKSQDDVVDNRPASERIAQLFESMAARRAVLVDIIECCRQIASMSEVEKRVEQAQASNHSVFTTANLCALLERAGALERVMEDGSPYEALDEVRTVVVDGVEYLEPVPTPELCWKTTQDAIDYLEQDDPYERLCELLENESQYKPIYHTILSLCATEGGVPVATVAAQVDSDPLLQNPRMFATRFLESLKVAEALIWDKTWQITPLGERILKEMDAA